MKKLPLYMLSLIMLVLCILTSCQYAPSKNEIISTTPVPTLETSSEMVQSNNDNKDEIVETTIPRIDANASDGLILLVTMPEIVELRAPLGNLIEEYSIPYIDGAFRANLYTLTTEYELILTTPTDTEIFDYIDYTYMSLDINNLTSGEILSNPTEEDDLEDFWLDDYLAQCDQYHSENTEPKFTDNFIGILNPDNAGAFIAVDIPDELANEIVNELKNAEDKIMVYEYQGTDSEFINMGIEVFLVDMDYEYSVLMWINKYGTKVIGFASDYSPVSEKAYDLIVNHLKEQIGWQEGWIPRLNSITSIELVSHGESLGKVTDTNDIEEITSMLSKSQCMVGGSYCPFNAELIFTYDDNSTSTIRLATNDTPAIVVGSSTYYDFGAGNIELGDKIEVKKLFLEYFDISEFTN